MEHFKQQATGAFISGVVTCTVFGGLAFRSDLALDAFRMGILLTVVVPPAILLAGFILHRKETK